MATIKVFSVKGVKELKCFDTLENADFLLVTDDEEMIADDGELSVGLPLSDEERVKLTRENFHAQFPDY